MITKINDTLVENCEQTTKSEITLIFDSGKILEEIVLPFLPL